LQKTFRVNSLCAGLRLARLKKWPPKTGLFFAPILPPKRHVLFSKMQSAVNQLIKIALYCEKIWNIAVIISNFAWQPGSEREDRRER
jgi:hypothetical protein